MPATRRPLLLLARLGDERLAGLAAAGDERAFELLYDRHHRSLLGFCRHMVGTREEAEDALQQTFLRAHRALAQHGSPDDLRPWLFGIARNRCLTLLAARRPNAEVDEQLADSHGLGDDVQTRADLRAVVADVAQLPDDQRAALVLAELADLSHAQIGEVIGVRTDKVKALIHQARTTLIAERDARERPCEDVREELATARGGALRRGPLRRHLRTCAPCRAYRDAVVDQRRTLALVLPVVPSAGLKAGILGAASTAGAGGAAASLGGGVAAKVVASALVVGAAGGGAALVEAPDPVPRKAVVERAPAAAAPEPPRARATTPGATVLSPVVTTPAQRAERRTRGRKVAKTRGERAATQPGESRRERAHARAPGQQKQAAKAPGSSRSVNAPPKKAKPVKPVKPVKPARLLKAEKPVKREKPAKPVIPVVVAPADEKPVTVIPKLKER